MGLFDYIGGKVRQAGEEVQKAQMEAEYWDARRICRELERTSAMAKCTGYARALRAKCSEMSDWELKSTFDDAYHSRNAKACNAMMTVMSERGLAHKDDNGRIVRDYR